MVLVEGDDDHPRLVGFIESISRILPMRISTCALSSTGCALSSTGQSGRRLSPAGIASRVAIAISPTCSTSESVLMDCLSSGSRGTMKRRSASARAATRNEGRGPGGGIPRCGVPRPSRSSARSGASEAFPVSQRQACDYDHGEYAAENEYHPREHPPEILAILPIFLFLQQPSSRTDPRFRWACSRVARSSCLEPTRWEAARSSTSSGPGAVGAPGSWEALRGRLRCHRVHKSLQKEQRWRKQRTGVGDLQARNWLGEDGATTGPPREGPAMERERHHLPRSADRGSRGCRRNGGSRPRKEQLTDYEQMEEHSRTGAQRGGQSITKAGLPY